MTTSSTAPLAAVPEDTAISTSAVAAGAGSAPSKANGKFCYFSFVVIPVDAVSLDQVSARVGHRQGKRQKEAFQTTGSFRGVVSCAPIFSSSREDPTTPIHPLVAPKGANK